MYPTTTQSVSDPRSPFWINRNFALLWGGQSVSNVGDFVFDTTLVLWVATQLAADHSWAPLAVGAVMVAVLVPTIVVGPLSGVFVDRWDKRRTMLAMDALRAVLVALLLVATLPLPFFPNGRLPSPVMLGAVYATVVLATVCAQFFTPSRMALIGDVVTAQERTRASSLGQITMNLAVIVGPPLATPLFFGLGVRWALAVNALSFLVSFLAIWLVAAPPAARSVAPGSSPNYLPELLAGLRFFSGNQVLKTLLIAGMVVMLGAGAMNGLDIFFVTGNLHASPRAFGFLSAAVGSGAIIGAIVGSWVGTRIGLARTFWLLVFAVSIGMLIYARLTSLAPALALCFVMGMPMGAVNVCTMPLVLQCTPREMIGRVGAVLNPSMSFASMASIGIASYLVSTALHSFHAAALGMQFGPVDTVFTAAGVLGLAGATYAMVTLWHIPHGLSAGAGSTSAGERAAESRAS